MNKKNLLIVDSYALCFRAYYGMINNMLINSKGENVSAISGFFTSLSILINKTKPDYLFIAADSKTKTFRHNISADYKANRPKTPEDLHKQIDIIFDILNEFDIPFFRKDGFEADDIIASAIEKYKDPSKLNIFHASGDKDLLQLVSNTSCVYQIRPNTKGVWEIYDCEKVIEKYTIPPSKIHLYLSLLGDSSDNISGVAGIGEKGAACIANECDCIEDIYSHISSFSNSIQKKLLNGRDDLYKSFELTALQDRIEIPYNLEDLDIQNTKASNGSKALNKIEIRSAAARMEREISSLIKANDKKFEEISLF